MKKYGIVLAAGMGTRMKSKTPKVLHKVLGRSMVSHAVSALEGASVEKVVAVIGHKSELLQAELGNRASYGIQTEQLGTAHAVMQARNLLEGLDGITIITYGDGPLLTSATLEKLVKHHSQAGVALTFLTSHTEDPTGYGRIVRNTSNGRIQKIVEQKDANSKELLITEINTGVCCVDNKVLFTALDKIDNNNSQGEYYLTDLVEIITDMGLSCDAFAHENFEETLGVNDRVQLGTASKIMQKRINETHMRNGVTLIDPENTYIEPDVVIESDVTIFPNVHLIGNTHISENCIVGMGSKILNSKIGNDCRVESSYITDSNIGSQTTVGPFSHIRANSEIGDLVRIGNFVEIKNTKFKKTSKAAHLSYIGDADVGEGANFGCHSATANYDGRHKYKTTIGNDVMIGCNVNLIAPVTIGNGAYLAAGSTITKDVEEDTLAVARSKQANKIGVAKKLKSY